MKKNDNFDFKPIDQINNELKDIKIKMDLKEYRVMIESHQQKMASHIYKIERFENRFDSKIKQAKIYPNWAVVVFIVSLVFGIISCIFILF